MKCEKCSTESPAGAKFCMGCGVKIEIPSAAKITTRTASSSTTIQVQKQETTIAQKSKEEEPEVKKHPIIDEFTFEEGIVRFNEHYIMWHSPSDDKLVKKVPLYALTGIKIEGGGMFGGGSKKLHVEVMTDEQTGQHTNKWMSKRLIDTEYDGKTRSESEYNKAFEKFNPKKMTREEWWLNDDYVKPEWYFIKRQPIEFIIPKGVNAQDAQVFLKLLQRYATIQRDWEGANPYHITIIGNNRENAMIIWDYDTEDACGSLYSLPAPQYLPPSKAAIRRGYHNMVILQEGFKPIYLKKIKLDEHSGKAIEIKLKKGEMSVDLKAKLAEMRLQQPKYSDGISKEGIDSEKISIVRGNGGFDLLTPNRERFICHIPYYKLSRISLRTDQIYFAFINGTLANKTQCLFVGTEGQSTIQNHNGKASIEILYAGMNPDERDCALLIQRHNHEDIIGGYWNRYHGIWGRHGEKRWHRGHVLYQKPLLEETSETATDPKDRTIKESDIRNNFARFSPFDFEHVIADLFKTRGYTIEGDVGVGSDRGIDVLAISGGKKIVIQVKKYTGNVGGPDINKTLGAMAAVEADSCIVITTGGFTQQALSIAKTAPNVEIWDGARTRKEFEITYLGANA